MTSQDILSASENMTKRFYVGNLFQDVSDIDLKKLFMKYGNIENVEIKNKRDIDGNNIATFAFVTIGMNNKNENAASQCIRECNNLKWKKNVIKVQVAQESFLQRLQNERKVSVNTPPSNTYNPMDLIKRHNIPQNDAEVDKHLKYDVNAFASESTTGISNSRTAKKPKGKENGIIEFTSDEEQDSRERASSRKISTLQANKRKVYHSSSDEEELPPKSQEKSDVLKCKERRPNIYTSNQTSKNTIQKKIDVSDTIKKACEDSKQTSPLPKALPEKRQYYSSSSDDEESSSKSRNKRKKIKSECAKSSQKNAKITNETFLSKLESFDSFWQDNAMEKDVYNPSSKLPSNEEIANSNSVIDKKIFENENEACTEPIKNKKYVLEEIKSKHQTFNISDKDGAVQTNLFSRNMPRFDPTEAEDQKFEVMNAANDTGLETDMQEKTEESAIHKNHEDKKFWMSSSFASDLSTRMKQGANQKIADTNGKASFSFGFDSSNATSGDNKNFSTGLSIEEAESKNTNSFGFNDKTNIFQDASSEEEPEDSDSLSKEKLSNQDILIKSLNRKNIELNSGEKFGLKLKEKAVFASVMNTKDGSRGQETKFDPFFFSLNDRRLEEGLTFMNDTESMDVLRTKFEEKRPILAEILRKKMRNRAKKQEKMSFGGTNRRTNNKKKKFGKKFKSHAKR